MRKTVSVKAIVEDANIKLAGWSRTPEERQGVIGMVENVLHQAGAYDGFTYLTEDDLSEDAHNCAQYNLNESGTVIDLRPGVRTALPRYHAGVDMWFADTDDTRRHYFINRKL